MKSNRKMHYHDRTVGYVIARESSRDSSTKLLYCTEELAIVALMMQAYLVSFDPPLPQDLITTVIIDEVHNRSAHSDYVLALTLTAMQKKSTLRLVLMSAAGDQSCARENPSMPTVGDEGSNAQGEKMFLRAAFGSIIQFVESDSADCDHISQ